MLEEKDIKKIEKVGANRFTFNGNIINEIGEESISNPFIAIAELIKNSYDADSKQILLKFSNIGKHNPQISLSDDGIGMDGDDIKNKWMDIGSPHKSEIEKSSEQGRIPVGAKGIGRFASHCLGKKLILITSKKEEINGYKLSFDWESFKKCNKATDVDNITEKFKKSKKTRGTSLIINNLKHDWNDGEKLRNLIKDLYLLTSPIDSPKNFKIKQHITQNCKDLKKITKSFLDKSAYRLSVKLSKKKNISYEFYKNNKLIKKDDGELDENLSCGDLHFDLYFYYKSKLAWQKWIGRDLAKKEIDEIRTMLEDYGGIKIYRDKFRVKPYGDKNADWIGLDKWSRDQSMVPGNTQTIGVVSLSKTTNPEIIDTTSREGVLNNSAYFDLIKFVTTSIKKFVDLRGEQETEKVKAKKIKKKKKGKTSKVKVELPRIEEPVSSPPDIKFIDVGGNFPNNHYNQLIYEANKCEENNYPNAAFWMSRKIVENLVFHVLEKKFPKELDLWYDKENKRNHSFSKLIENLSDKKTDFELNLQELIDQFKTDVGKFKKAVDATIHRNHVYLSDKEELKQYKINKIIQILLDIFSRI